MTTAAAEPVTAPDAAPAVFAPDVGDEVHVLFWRPNVMPGGADVGGWDTMSGRVVTPGPALTAYAATNDRLPAEWGNENPHLGGVPPVVRFARADRCFPTRAAALKAAETLTPPR